MGQFANAFAWQVFARVGEEVLVAGLFPTDADRRHRSASSLAALLITGNVALVCTTLLAPIALLAWVFTGHGPGHRLLLYSAGGPRSGRLLVSRATEMFSGMTAREHAAGTAGMPTT